MSAVADLSYPIRHNQPHKLTDTSFTHTDHAARKIEVSVPGIVGPAVLALAPSESEAHGLRSWPRGSLGLKSLKASLTPVGPPSARECGGYLVLSEPQVQFGPHVHGEQVQFGL